MDAELQTLEKRATEEETRNGQLLQLIRDLEHSRAAALEREEDEKKELDVLREEAGHLKEEKRNAELEQARLKASLREAEEHARILEGNVLAAEAQTKEEAQALQRQIEQ